jgi:hypothetical protein
MPRATSGISQGIGRPAPARGGMPLEVSMIGQQSRGQHKGPITHEDAAHERDLAQVVNKKSPYFKEVPVDMAPGDESHERILNRNQPGNPHYSKRKLSCDIGVAGWLMKRAMMSGEFDSLNRGLSSMIGARVPFLNEESAADKLVHGPFVRDLGAEQQSLYHPKKQKVLKLTMTGVTDDTGVLKGRPAFKENVDAIQTNQGRYQAKKTEDNVVSSNFLDRDAKESRNQVKISAPIPEGNPVHPEDEKQAIQGDNTEFAQRKSVSRKSVVTGLGNPSSRARVAGSFGDSYKGPNSNFLTSFLNKRYG